MKVNEYYELLRLAEALNLIVDSQLLWKLYSDAGYLYSDAVIGQLRDLLCVVADGVRS